jgi:hypothetical protein
MAHVSQADFARAARGAPVLGGQGSEIEPIIGGISSIARCAVRDVHRKSPEAAMAYYNAGTAKWLLLGGSAAAAVRTYHDSLAQYIAWDGGSGVADFDVGLRKPAIMFGPSNSVRALAHVVRDLGGGQREVRVLLWDDPPLNAGSAEMIALPLIERVDGEYGQGSTTQVGVWQVAQPQQETVTPAAAAARRTDVQTLLAEL